MCIHTKVKKYKRHAKELRLLQKVIRKADMSLLSSCLECVRTGTDSRYVTAAPLHRLQLRGRFQPGFDVDLTFAAIGEVLLQAVGEQAHSMSVGDCAKHAFPFLLSHQVGRSDKLV